MPHGAGAMLAGAQAANVPHGHLSRHRVLPPPTINTVAPWFFLAPALLLGARTVSVPAEKVQLTIATLHAAALTASRAAGDSTDARFVVVEVAGPATRTASMLPGGGQTVMLA